MPLPNTNNLWWRFKNAIASGPKTLDDLRLFMDGKAESYYATGWFWYSPEVGDGKKGSAKGPVLLLSSDGTPGIFSKHKEYKDLVKSAKSFVCGTYKAGNKEKPNAFYEFVLDASKNDFDAAKDVKAFEAKLATLMKDKGWEEDLRACLGTAAPKAIKFCGKTVDPLKATGKTHVIAEWDLTKLLTTKNDMMKEPLEGAWIVAGKEKQFSTRSGMIFAEKTPVKCVLSGGVADVTLKNAAVADEFRKNMAPIMQKLFAPMAKDLSTIDRFAVKLKWEPKIAAEKAEKAIATLQSQFQAAAAESASDLWFKYCQEKVEYKQYYWDSRFEFAAGVGKSVVGVGSALAAPLSGPVAILGLISAIKTSIETVSMAYQMYREKEVIVKDLEEAADARLLEKANALGAGEVARQFIASATGLDLTKHTKTIEKIEEDTKKLAKRALEDRNTIEKRANDITVLLDKQEEINAELAKLKASPVPADQKQAESLKKQLAVVESQTALLLEITVGSANETGLFEAFRKLVDERLPRILERVEEAKKAQPAWAKISKTLVKIGVETAYGIKLDEKGVEKVVSITLKVTGATADLVKTVAEVCEKEKIAATAEQVGTWKERIETATEVAKGTKETYEKIKETVEKLKKGIENVEAGAEKLKTALGIS